MTIGGPRHSRRRFLTAMAGGLILPATVRPFSHAIADLDLATSPFAFGVASGDPLPDRVVIWTRLKLQAADAERDTGDLPIEVRWEVFESADAAASTLDGTAVAWPELGYSVHVDVSGLAPGREYWFRFRCGGQVSDLGRTRTADPGATSVRFAVVSCNNYEHGYFRAFDLISRDGLDFVFHAGDYIYEGAPKGGTPRGHTGGACVTLSDYRRRYEQYRSDPDLQALHRTTPFIASWDDHEVAGNWANLNDKFGTPVEVFQHRRQAAFQAFYEFLPIRIGKWMSRDPFPLYRSFRFGGDLHFVVLDTRQFRSDQACGDDKVTTACAELRDADRTMLGRRQFDWLETRLRENTERWTVVGNQVPSYLRNLGGPDEARYSMDKWDGYPHAQQAFHSLLKQFADGSCLVLSGDLHAHYASELRRDWSRPGSTFGTEFTVTSISSGGDGGNYKPDWPSLRQNNPHIGYHSNRRGYLRCEASRDFIDAEFVVLDKVSVPGGKASIDARARLTRGAAAAGIRSSTTDWKPWSAGVHGSGS